MCGGGCVYFCWHGFVLSLLCVCVCPCALRCIFNSADWPAEMLTFLWPATQPRCCNNIIFLLLEVSSHARTRAYTHTRITLPRCLFDWFNESVIISTSSHSRMDLPLALLISADLRRPAFLLFSNVLGSHPQNSLMLQRSAALSSRNLLRV